MPVASKFSPSVYSVLVGAVVTAILLSVFALGSRPSAQTTVGGTSNSGAVSVSLVFRYFCKFLSPSVSVTTAP